MSCRPAFSVVVPVHNAGRFVLEAVASVRAQTFAEFELILVDDGSTDNCLCPVAALTDPRICILRQERRGAPAALNAGIMRARGQYIAFLDHDDVWEQDKLASHLTCFDCHLGTDMTFDWSVMIDENGAGLHLRSRPWRGTISFSQLLEDFVVRSTSAMVIRRAAIEQAGGLNPCLPRLYDFDLCLRVSALKPGNCRSVGAHLTRYRRHPGQMSRDWRGLQREWEDFLRQVPAYAPSYDGLAVAQILPVANGNMRRYFSWLACEEGDYASALRLISSAFRTAPRRALTETRNWMLLAAILGGLSLPEGVYRKVTTLGKRLLA